MPIDLPKNQKLNGLKRSLRRNATEAENRLWYDFLRTYPVQFRRQFNIGNYIVDFYCDKAQLIVELDGSQHYDSLGLAKDNERTKYFEQFNLKVLRFSNYEINTYFYEVCQKIDDVVGERFTK